MITITKEWLQKAISQHEAMRDEIPFGLDEDDTKMLAAMRIALASLEAEPVGYVDAEYAELLKQGHIESCSVYAEPGGGGITVFSAPPAPVSVPDEKIKGDEFELDGPLSCYQAGKIDGWNECRAAMLQSFGNSEQLNSPALPDGLRLALSNAGIAAPESDEMLAATCEKYIQELVTWVKDRKPFRSAAPQQEVKNG